ncbi:MAG: hypothetical protein KF729_21750 [Sandaracinaceae bacterium]|nr:hypothetical protein [Sandaracinaceae bacterium]
MRAAATVQLALGALALGLALAPGARAQLGPRRELRAELAHVAAPGARLTRDDAGLVRGASGLWIAAPGASPEARAEAFLRRFRGELALAPGAVLVHERTVAAHGYEVVRLSRGAFGGRVHGGSVVVRLRGDAVEHLSLAGVGAPLASSSALDPAPAGALALASVPGAIRVEAASPGGLELDGRVEPVVVVDLAGEHLHERWRVLVGASGVLAAHPRAADALGRVYPRDPTSDMEVTADVELTDLTSRERLTGRYFRALQCNAGARGCQPAQGALADENGDFLFDPVEPSYDDAFAEVHGYHHATRVAAHFRDVHGFSVTCRDGGPMRLIVNYTERPMIPYDNAAFQPGGSDCGTMLFGQGRTRDFVYDADVVYHEYGHAVVDGISDLGFFAIDAFGVGYDPGAVNEGYADYVAATISGDPHMAEYFRGAGLGAEGSLRELDNELVCPDGRVGEAHFDGRILGGAAWDMREAIGAQKTDALMYSAMSAIASLASLADAAETILAAADALLASGGLDPEDRATVASILEARGLIGCDRVAPLDGDVTRLAYSGTATLTGNVGGAIAPVHYRIAIPADAVSLHVGVTSLTIPGGAYSIAYRVGAPVRFLASRRPPYIANGTLRPGERLARDTDPPLPRCETLYLAIVTDNLADVQQALYEVRANLVRSGLDEACEVPDAGAPAGEDAGVTADAAPGGGTAGGGGCTCRASGRGAGSSAGLALVALAATAQRMRRSWRSIRRIGVSK